MQLPGLRWQAYELPDLDLRGNHGDDASSSTDTVATDTTVQDLWRRHADEAISSCLCVCLKHSAQAVDNSKAICLNSAMYGGLETGRYLRPAYVSSMRAKVGQVERELICPRKRTSTVAAAATESAGLRRALTRCSRRVALCAAACRLLPRTTTTNTRPRPSPAPHEALVEAAVVSIAAKVNAKRVPQGHPARAGLNSFQPWIEDDRRRTGASRRLPHRPVSRRGVAHPCRARSHTRRHRGQDVILRREFRVWAGHHAPVHRLDGRSRGGRDFGRGGPRRLDLEHVVRSRASRGVTALHKLRPILTNGNLPTLLKVKLVESLITPVLTYSSEWFGLSAEAVKLNRVQVTAGRWILGETSEIEWSKTDIDAIAHRYGGFVDL